MRAERSFSSRHERRHPILLAGYSLIIARCLALSIPPFMVATDLVVTLAAVATAILTYAGEALLLTASALLLWTLAIVRPLRVLFTAAALVCLAFVMFLSLSDPILQAIIGERLTPSTLRHYAGPGLFLSNYFWAPVRTYWLPVGAAVTVLGAYLAWLAWMFVSRGLHPERTPVRLPKLIALSVGGAALYWGPPALELPYVPQPVEIAYVQEVLGVDRTPLMTSETRAVNRVRDLLGLPTGARWLSDDYPLVYAPAQQPSAQAPARPLPDIYLVIIESLRGENLSFINPAAEWTVATPRLAELAERGVVFRRHISSGFPTGPGQIAALYGAWPHLVKRIIVEFKAAGLDGIPARLQSLGYRSIHVEHGPSFDKGDAWIDGVYDTHVDPGRDGLPGFERHLVDYAVRAIQAHDRREPREPLFLVFITSNPHLPYEAPDEQAGRLTAGPDLAQNYRASLASVDAQLGRLFQFLDSRSSATDALLVVTGDHANFLDQKRTTSLPVNDTQWTGSIFVGPQARIGAPRYADEPASHADILPTILGFVGDRRPTAALGRDLFDPNGRPARHAVAVRNGGTRYDSGASTMMLKRNDPALAKAVRLFPDAPEPSKPEPSLAEDVALAARLWSFLLETNRAWSPTLLNGP
jgi:arylsulfatase A-like enzyme